MKILLATDGSEFSNAAIEMLPNIVAKPETTSIKIISAFEHPNPIGTESFAISVEYYNDLDKIRQTEATKFVEQAESQILKLFPDQKPDLTTRVIVGSPPQIIVETANEWEADLIIIGSHGYGFWSRVLLGSVSNSVLQHAHCSVLIVRKAKEETKEK